MSCHCGCLSSEFVYHTRSQGVVHGLTRARGFTQDDAHIYCTKEQMPGRLDSLLTFVLDLLRNYGLDDFYLELSTRDPEKSIGSDDQWEEAPRPPRRPPIGKIWSWCSIQAVPPSTARRSPCRHEMRSDVPGRCRPSRLTTTSRAVRSWYQAADGTRQRPIMIHRAPLRVDRTILCGAARALRWRLPAMVGTCPGRGYSGRRRHASTYRGSSGRYVKRGIRAEVDTAADRMPKKIRNAQKAEDPLHAHHAATTTLQPTQ